MVVTPFERAFRIVVGEEGGFTLDPRDKGNWSGGEVDRGELKGTKFGISAAAFPALDIRSLTLEDARRIYADLYWRPIRGDELPLVWALLMFDCAVNQGVGTAILLAQDACGVQADGKFGPRTLAALQSGDDRRPARFLARRAQRYMKLATFPIYGDGWLTRTYRIALEAHQ